MRLRLLVLPSALILLGAGCFSPPATPEADAPASSEPVASAPSECGHPYYPMKPGSAITFQSIFKDRPDEFTVTVKSNADGKATLEYDFEGVGKLLTQAVECDKDGSLKAKGYLDLASALSESKFEIETKTVSGVFLPADLKVGSEWGSIYDVNITPQDSAVLKSLGITTINQQATISNQAMAQERITISAGTYEALRVETKVKLDATLSGSSPMNAITVTGTEWWVRGIGMVKSASVANGTQVILEAKTITP